MMKIDVFGRGIEVLHSDNGWDVYYLGNEGKRRKAEDIIIPSDTKKDEIVLLISDLCHEWAGPHNNEVKVLKE